MLESSEMSDLLPFARAGPLDADNSRRIRPVRCIEAEG
jgi:hypothetical protein